MACRIQVPFLLHGLVALPASVNYLRIALHLPLTARLPDLQLQLQTRFILISYALLLLSTSVTSLVLAFGLSLSPSTERSLAGGMAVYHFGPILRAYSRLQDLDRGTELGGPGVHLVVHVFVLAALGTTVLGST